MRTWIDVHHHFFTPRYIEEMAGIGIAEPDGRPWPTLSIDDSVAAMDRLDVETAMLSLGPPGLPFPDDKQRRELARSLNEEAAAGMARHPGRLGLFAALPLPDVDAAIEEAVYALDTLGADGIGLFSNHRGVYLGDPRFEPLFEELDRRDAVVFIHGTMCTGSEVPAPPNTGSPIPAFPAAMFELQFDLTRTIAYLLASGALAKHPNVRFIVSHAGGGVPYLSHRLRGPSSDGVATMLRQAATSTPEEIEQAQEAQREQTRAALQRLYYDTAVSANPTTLGLLKDLALRDHILSGTDFPMGPMTSSMIYFKNMVRHSGLTGEELADNARALFPRLRRSAPV